MSELYASIKWLHIACVLSSGTLFALRGVLAVAGQNFGNHIALRWLSYAIDTTLLTTALMLIGIVHQYPFVHDWLTVKVLLLVVYIVLGVFALRRARTRRAKALCYVAALAVFVFIVSVARNHHPLGAFATLAAG